ncbi:MAG: MFS transporter [Pirellulaceae bacterium]|nr:MFS transporter [Pirellulaceae bacterium]
MDDPTLTEPDSPISLFRYRLFRHYWTSRVSSMSAYQMQVVATGWSVYELTESPLALGLVGLAQFIPRVLLTLWAGAVADRHDRRTVAFICTAVQWLACTILALGSWQGFLTREGIFVLVAVMGAARSFEMPTMQSLLPNLVPTDAFPRALAMSTAATQIAIIGGPALAGVVFMVSVTAVYAVAAGLFLVSSAMMLTMPRVPTVQLAQRSNQSLLAGLHYIAGQPVVLGAISLDLFAVLLGGATAMLPIFAKDILHVGPTGLGLLQAAPAAGALAMTLYLSRHPLSHGIGKQLFVSVAIFGLFTIVFGVSESFWLSIASLVILGAADCVSVVIRQSLVQLETPDDMRGRVSAVNSVFIGASNQLGEFESGVMAAWLGIVPSVVVGGAGTLVIVALWAVLFPTLLRRDRLDQSPKP